MTVTGLAMDKINNNTNNNNNKNTSSNNGSATVISNNNNDSNHNSTTGDNDGSGDNDGTGNNDGISDNDGTGKNDGISDNDGTGENDGTRGDLMKSPRVEEAIVVDSVVQPNCSPSMSIISLSTASAASVDDFVAELSADGVAVRVPNSPVAAAQPASVNSPANTMAQSPVSSSPNSAHFNSDFLSCFAPLGRFWPHNLFNWTSQKQIHSADSDTENYEIPIDSIDVQWEENFIGGGNQSSVFRAKYRGQWIALKKLNRTSEVDIKQLCSLEHANVIKTLGICTKEHFPCIVMEYCEKGSLFEHLRRNPKISKSMFISCATQIAEGMCYLHTLKIVHRDLKSPNILIDNKNIVKICDFGSLYSWDQRLNSQNLQGMSSVVMSVCGTSQWMSPEMLTNKPCNERVDVWSYGVVLWELLTGEVPYDKLPPTTVWFLVGSGNLQLHVPKTAPGSVSFLLTLCWAKNPRNRPSFKTILKDLLSNVRAELYELQEEGWGYRREQWKRDIGDKMAKLHNSGMDLMGEQQREQELVKKRMHELRHAQEIRQMYEEKLQRVNKMHTKMCRFTELINERKRDNERVADAMGERLAYDAHWHATLHEWHAELREWHAELRQKAAAPAAAATTATASDECATAMRTNAIKMQNINDNGELRHILLRAETAKTAAMLTHGQNGAVDEREQLNPSRASSSLFGKIGGTQQIRTLPPYRTRGVAGQAVSAPTVAAPASVAAPSNRPPAMPRMTFYDDDDGIIGVPRHIGQKVVMAQQQQLTAAAAGHGDGDDHVRRKQLMITNAVGKVRKSQRQPISSPTIAGSSALTSCSSSSSSSSSSRDCSSTGEEDDQQHHHHHQQHQAVSATQPPLPAAATNQHHHHHHHHHHHQQQAVSATQPSPAATNQHYHHHQHQAVSATQPPLPAATATNQHHHHHQQQAVSATQPATNCPPIPQKCGSCSCRHCSNKTTTTTTTTTHKYMSNMTKKAMGPKMKQQQLSSSTTVVMPPITPSAQQRQQQQHEEQQFQRHQCQCQQNQYQVQDGSNNNRMGSCSSSDTVVLPSCSFGRHSAEFESSSPSKPISRDDSAISSTMPFSPSDRSLQQHINNNNSKCPPSNVAACLNYCQFGGTHQPQQISQFFARNSVARASGLSADSGVCQEDECVADGNANTIWLNAADNCCSTTTATTCCLAPNTCQCTSSMLALAVAADGTATKITTNLPTSSRTNQPTSSSSPTGIRTNPPANSRTNQPTSSRTNQPTSSSSPTGIRTNPPANSRTNQPTSSRSNQPTSSSSPTGIRTNPPASSRTNPPTSSSSSTGGTTMIAAVSNCNKWSSTKQHYHHHHHQQQHHNHHHVLQKEARLRRRRPPVAAAVVHGPTMSELSETFARNCSLRKPSSRRGCRSRRRRLEQQGALDYDLLERLGSSSSNNNNILLCCSSAAHAQIVDQKTLIAAGTATDQICGSSLSINNNNNNKSSSTFISSTNCCYQQQTTVADQTDQKGRCCRPNNIRSSSSSDDQSDQTDDEDDDQQHFVPQPAPSILIGDQHHPHNNHHQHHHWFSTPELYQHHTQQHILETNDDDDAQHEFGDVIREEMVDGSMAMDCCEQPNLNVGDSEQEQKQLQLHNIGIGMSNFKLCPISEMTDIHQQNVMTQKAMDATLLESLLSSSTMVSSLERSLELSAAHSDGLSDKEAKLKEVKTTFKLTHRRTSSNPTYFSRTMPAHPQQQQICAKNVGDGHKNSCSVAEDETTTESEEKDDDQHI